MPSRRGRITISVRMDGALASRLRAYVKDHAGAPAYWTLASFCEQAVEAHLALVEGKLAGSKHDQRRTPSNNSRM